jgi:predicted ATPase
VRRCRNSSPVFRQPEDDSIPSGNYGFKISLKEYDFNFKSLFNGYGNPPAIITGKFSSGASIQIYFGANEYVFAFVRNEKGRFVRSVNNALRLHFPSVSCLPQISALDQNEKLLTSDYVRSRSETPRASWHFRNNLNEYKEHYDAFVDLSQSTWPTLRIRNLDKNLIDSGYELSLIVEDQRFSVEISWMGHGLQMWLQTIWFLARSSNSDCIILDEPDVYLHADLQRKLIKLLSSWCSQIIIATHSFEIISEVQPEFILTVDNRKKFCKYLSNIEGLQDALNNMPMPLAPLGVR